MLPLRPSPKHHHPHHHLRSHLLRHLPPRPHPPQHRRQHYKLHRHHLPLHSRHDCHRPEGTANQPVLTHHAHQSLHKNEDLLLQGSSHFSTTYLLDQRCK